MSMLSAVLLTLMRVLKLKTLSNPLIFSVKKKVISMNTLAHLKHSNLLLLKSRHVLPLGIFGDEEMSAIIFIALVLFVFLLFFLSFDFAFFYFFRNEMVKWFVLSHLKSKHILGNENLAKIRRIGGKSRQ